MAVGGEEGTTGRLLQRRLSRDTDLLLENGTCVFDEHMTLLVGGRANIIVGGGASRELRDDVTVTAACDEMWGGILLRGSSTGISAGWGEISHSLDGIGVKMQALLTAGRHRGRTACFQYSRTAMVSFTSSFSRVVRQREAGLAASRKPRQVRWVAASRVPAARPASRSWTA